jgi:hypothetical protein
MTSRCPYQSGSLHQQPVLETLTAQSDFLSAIWHKQNNTWLTHSVGYRWMWISNNVHAQSDFPAPNDISRILAPNSAENWRQRQQASDTRRQAAITWHDNPSHRACRVTVTWILQLSSGRLYLHAYSSVVPVSSWVKKSTWSCYSLNHSTLTTMARAAPLAKAHLALFIIKRLLLWFNVMIRNLFHQLK